MAALIPNIQKFGKGTLQGRFLLLPRPEYILSAPITILKSYIVYISGGKQLLGKDFIKESG